MSLKHTIASSPTQSKWPSSKNNWHCFQVIVGLNALWRGIRAKVCVNCPHWLHCWSLSTFGILSFMFKGHCVCVHQLPVMINIIPFTSLFFLFGFVCCILCMTSWHFCFLRHSVLALRRTFFIVVFKWALFDWSYVRYSRDVGRRFYMKKHLALGRS